MRRPAFVSDVSTWRYRDADGITLAVSAPTPEGTVSVALEVPGGLGAGGVWADRVPVELLAAHLGVTR